MITELSRAEIRIPLRHAANSAGILDLPSSYFDLMRPGIMMYGLYPSKEVTHTINLKPAMSFKTAIAYLKTVPAGTSISYGRSFIARKKSLIAILPVGYADGYSRSLSNKGQVLIRGRRAPIAGRIAPLAGSFYLAKHEGGSGKFIGGVPGVPPARVVILGGNSGDECSQNSGGDESSGNYSGYKCEENEIPR